jgi:hypothetical protein
MNCVKGAELKAFGNSEHPSSLWQLHVDPCVLLREAAKRLFTLLASELGVERLWSGARRTLTDTRWSMTSARLVQLLLVLMNPNLINDQALLERLGVQGSASLAMDFDCKYKEIVLMDEEDLVVERCKSTHAYCAHALQPATSMLELVGCHSTHELVDFMENKLPDMILVRN